MKLRPCSKWLTILPLKGARRIWNSKLFSFTENLFVNYKSKKESTAEMLIRVYEMQEKSTLMEFLQSMPGDWTKRALTQSQVIYFCENFSRYLAEKEVSTFFLIKKDENAGVDMFNPARSFVFAGVCVRPEGLSIHQYDLDATGIWDPKDRPRRFVFPKIVGD